MKPYRSEALLRLRANSVALTFLGIASYLLPVPSLPTAARVSWHGFKNNGVADFLGYIRGGSMYEGFCLLEFFLISVLVFNIGQAVFALRFPRKPPPPKVLPPTPRPSVMSPQAQKTKLSQALSPSASPQPSQRPFRTPGHTNSFTLSFASSSSQFGSPQVGKDSPKPSNMTSPNMNASLAASTMSFSSSMGSPSPVLSAYRGKHIAGAGRPVEAPFLNRLLAAKDESDDEDDGR